MYQPTFIYGARSATEEEASNPPTPFTLDGSEEAMAMEVDMENVIQILRATYQTDTLGDTFLAAAISRFDEAIDDMRFMLNMLEIDVNYQDPTLGLTALHGAVSHGLLPMVRFLLHECVAEVNIKDHSGNLALDLVENLDPTTRIAIVNEYIRVSKVEIPAGTVPRRRVELKPTHKNGVYIRGPG